MMTDLKQNWATLQTSECQMQAAETISFPDHFILTSYLYLYLHFFCILKSYFDLLQP